MRHHVWLSALLVTFVLTVHGQPPSGCPVADNPANLARCIQIDIVSIVQLASGSTDYTGFCALAARYMECFKTYTKGCVGGMIGEGTFNELINTAYYCCNGVTASPNCPFNPNVQRNCIHSNAIVQMSDGSFKTLNSLEIGDTIKTLDSSTGKLINTDVILMLDINDDEEALFLNIETYSQKSIKVSQEHLVAVKGYNEDFKLARSLKREDLIVTFDHVTNERREERIKSILIEPVQGYSAPLTIEGTLLADGVLVSSYAVVHKQYLAHMAMAPVRWMYQFNEQFMKKTLPSLANRFLFDKQMNGTHWYPGLVHSITNQFLTSFVELN